MITNIDVILNLLSIWYSVFTNFRLEIIEPSAKELFFIWTLVEKEKHGDE